MTKPVCTTTSQFLRDIRALDIRFTPEERAVLSDRAKKSIEESKRAMLVRMPCSKTIH